MLCDPAVLLAGLLVAGTAAAANSPGKVTIRWHGQSFFEIDLQQGHAHRHRSARHRGLRPQGGAGDLVLMSHLHNDHTQVGVVKNQQGQIIRPQEARARPEWNISR